MAFDYEAGSPAWNSQSIRALRRHLGLTQREMADKLGTRQQTISEWEVGQYEPRGASARLLSIVAERESFKYDALLPSPKSPKRNPAHPAQNAKT